MKIEEPTSGNGK